MLLAGGSGGKRGAPTCVAATFFTRASRRGLRACRQVSTLSRPAGFARLLLGINNV